MRVLVIVVVVLLIITIASTLEKNMGYLYHEVAQPFLTKKYNAKQQLFGKVFFDLFPYIDRLKASSSMNISKDATFEYCIFSAPSLVEALKDVKIDALNALLQMCEQHIHLNESPVDLSDCLVVDVFTAQKGAFPMIHTDIEWKHFPGDGFQVWYLLENASDDHGNMFLFETPEEITPYRQTNLMYQGDQWFEKNVCGNILSRVHATQLHPKYVGITKGQCLIFGQNVLHMSDPRRSERSALTMRVVHKVPTIHFLMKGLALNDFYSLIQILRIMKILQKKRIDRYDFSNLYQKKINKKER